MAKAGLSPFGSPTLTAMNLEPLGNPYDPTPNIGVGNLTGNAMESLTGAAEAARSQFAMPTTVTRPSRPQGSTVLYNPAQEKMFVNGSIFDLDDADTALRVADDINSGGAEAFQQAPTRPAGEGWSEVPPEMWSQYINDIRNPSLGRRFSENFGTGVAQLRQLFGAGATLLGAEEYGLGVMERAEEDIRKNSPFYGEATDIGLGEDDLGPIEWFVGTLGTQGPMLLETIGVGLAGFFAGSAAAPGLGSVAGTVAGVFGKKEFKRRVLDAAQEYAAERAKGRAAAQAFLRTDRGQILRRAAGMTGAVAAGYANNYGLASSDVYQELLDSGVDPQDYGAKMTALLSGIPYAALDTIPEFVLGAKLFGGVRLGQRGGRLRRGATGAGAGAVLEGTTEAGQEAIIMGATSAYTGREYESDETLARLINSFAAGAAIGGGIGGVTNALRSTDQGDLLRGMPTEQEPEPETTPQEPTQQELFPEDTDFGTAPVQPTAPEQLELFPDQNLGEGVDPNQLNLFDQPVIPSQQPGFQMELPFGQQRLMAQREPVQQEMELVAPVGAQPDMFSQQATPPMPEPAPIQPTPPAPVQNVVESIQQTAAQQPQPQPNLLQQRMQEAAQNKLAADAAAQQQAELQAETNRLQAERLQIENERIERNNRELLNAVELERAREEIAAYEAEQQGVQRPQTPPVAAPVQNLPTVPVPVASPRQMDLFRGQVKVPKPSKAEQKEINKQNRLRRKQEREAEAAAAEAARPMTAAEARAAGQGILFTQRGEPSVAALKAAGTVEPATPELTQVTPAEEAVVAQQRLKGKATDDLTLFRAGALDADPAPDGFMYLANDKRAAQGGAKQPIRRASVQFDNLLEVKSRNEFDTQFGIADGSDITRVDAARVAGYDGIAFSRNPLSKAPWKEYLVLNPDTVTFIDDVATGAATLRRGEANAVQEQSTESVDGGQPARPSEAVRSGDEVSRKSTATDRAQERLREEKASKAASRTEEANAAVREANDQQGAQENIVQERPDVTDFTYTEVTEEQEIAADLILDFEISDSMSDMRATAVALVDYAYFGEPARTDANASKPQRDYAAAVARVREFYERAYKDPEYFTDEQLKVLDDTFVRFATAQNERSSGTKNKVAPWYTYASRRFLIPAIEKQTTITGTPHKNTGVVSANASPTTEVDTRVSEDAARDMDEQQGNFYREDGSVINGTLNNIQVRGIVTKALAKLKLKPTVTIVRNQADLANVNPELYRQARASRPNNDFDTVNASGFSVGDQIILFTDNLKTEKQVRFVLAHETMGHFGLRAFMPPAQLKKLFNDIYNNDMSLRYAIDNKMDMGMDKMEAVEEVLADAAAYMDMSVVKRIIDAIKNVLNSLGFDFQDDLARYMIRQSRRNLLQGGSGLVSAQELRRNLQSLTTENMLGRFSAETQAADVASRSFSSFAHAKAFGDYGGMRGLKNFLSKAKEIENYNDAKDFLGEILESVQTLDNKAKRSEGLQMIFDIFQDRANRARRFLNGYKNLTAYSNQAWTVNWDGNKVAAPTEEEKLQAGALLAYGARHKQRAVTEQQIRENENLVDQLPDGSFAINSEALESAEAAGAITREQFAEGILVYIGDPDNEQTELWKPSIKVDGEEVPFTITDNVWRIYTEQRAAVNKSAQDVVMAVIEGGVAQKDATLALYKDAYGMTDAEVEVMRKVMDKYIQLYNEGATAQGGSFRYNGESTSRASFFLREVNRALFESKKVEDWVKGEVKFKYGDKETVMAGTEYQDIIDGLQGINARYKTPDANRITSAIGNLFLLDVQAANAQYRAKQTIMNAYVPFTRRGQWQVRLQAVDSTGNPVAIDPTWASVLPYYQADNRADSREIMNNLNTEFEGAQITITDSTGQEKTVQFQAVMEKKRQGSPLGQQQNINDFIQILSRLDVNINPDERNRIIEALTRQEASARRSIERQGVAGWDPNVLRSTAEYLETQAHVAGQAFYRHRLNNIMLSDRLWRGDVAKLDRLYAETQRTDLTPEQKRKANAAYDDYALKYSNMAAIGQREAINRLDPTKTLRNKGQGEMYKGDALKLQQFYAEAGNIVDSTEDLLSGETGSKIKMFTVVAQLGGSLATAMVNSVSLATHAHPYLAFYNEGRAYGGGFGWQESGLEISRAVNNMKNHKLSDSDYLDQVVASKDLQKKHRLTQAEAVAMRDMTYQGVLQSAQANALVGTSRGGVYDNRVQSAIQTWMLGFTYTEQLNRRATALASFRLHKARAIAGTPEYTELQQKGNNRTEAETTRLNELEDQFNQEASDFAKVAVNTSQGEYAMFNRPEMARGNIGQYIFIYKQFSIITVQMLRHMPVKGQLNFLALLFLFAGLKGLPFADDLMELYDTLMQKLNFTQEPVELQLNKLLNELAPGIEPYVMRGFLDQFMAGTISTRLGFGDLIPLTGIGLAGASWQREVSNFMGPMYSSLEGASATVGAITRYGAEAVGLRPDLTSFRDVLKEFPAAGVRAISDALTYYDSGIITNGQGKLVDSDASMAQILFRAMGFYPSVATRDNDIVRMGKQHAAYIQSWDQGFKNKYIKAYLTNDFNMMNDVLDMVDDWNFLHQGTAFELLDFERRAKRAAKLAELPTAERYLRSSPRAVRDDLRLLMDIYDVETTGDL